MTSRSDGRETAPPGPLPLDGSPRGLRPRRGLSIGAKFALGVVTAVAVVSGLVGMQLDSSARASILGAKQKAARMVVDSFVPGLGPALDFGDAEAISEHVERLKQSRDVIRVATWNAQQASPMVTRPQDNTVLARPTADSEQLLSEELAIARIVRSPTGTSVGALSVEFTLRPENAAYRAARQRIAWWVVSLALALAAIVIGIARQSVVQPLSKLLAAMQQVRSGQAANLRLASHDEIGQLVAGFNEMSGAIRQREQWLSEERERTQELLDHMRQAILVVGSDGDLLSRHSRAAELLFGMERLHGSLVDLFSGRLHGDVEREVLQEWLELALSSPTDQWSAIVELAPSEVNVADRLGETRQLDLEFRPIADGDRIACIMLLCTDVTAQRSLEREVREKDADHERQMGAMRALVAGGGQLLVTMLDGAHGHIDACHEILSHPEIMRDDIDSIFQKIHTLKGEGRVFELDALARAAADLECEIGVLRARVAEVQTVPGSEATARLVPGLQSIVEALRRARAMLVDASPIGDAILDQVTVRRSDLQELERVVGTQCGPIAAVVRRLAGRPFGEVMLSFPSAAKRWGESIGKRIALDVSGRDVVVERSLAGVLPGVLTHLVRNAIAHGIETEEERVEAGKSPLGHIEIRCQQTPTGVEVVVSDDGQGIDEDAVMARVRAIDGTVDSPLEAVFLPGLSTVNSQEMPGDLAGRGMGLSAVRRDLAALGFRVEIRSRRSLGLDVHISPS
jgi:two-component system, chemotaxis family, sensor kinase CheA